VNEPRLSQDLDDILAICLDHLLRGEKTLAECLHDYPDHAAELKPALQIAFLTMRLKSAEMPETRVDALESRLRAQMVDNTRPIQLSGVRYLPLGLSRLAAALIIGFILTVGSGAGLVAASADDLPGDTLYGVKRLWETIVLTFAPLTGQPGDLWLQLAETRLDEVNRLAAEGRLTQQALLDLYSASYYVTYYGGDASAIIAYFNRAYLALFNRIQPPSDSATVYGEVIEAVNPVNRLAPDGTIIPLPDAQPPSLMGQVAPTPTATTSPTPTDTPTLIPSATLTPTKTATLIPTATDTPTPRIPPTATRTPTYTPSPTVTLTFTPSPTMTWTPLPLPGGLPGNTAVSTPVPPGVIPSSTPVVLTLDATERVRATQQSVYMTQTAEVQESGGAGGAATEEP
jgi:hypothetical protein